jgi:hypothetical protein
MFRITGTVLLIAGFFMLATAWAINDLDPNYANNAGGGLTMLGRAVGILGVLFLIIGVSRTFWRLHSPVRRRNGKSTLGTPQVIALGSPAYVYSPPVPAVAYPSAIRHRRNP